MRELVEKAFSHIGRKIDWRGKGADEKGYDAQTAKCWLKSMRVISADRSRFSHRRSIEGARETRLAAQGFV